MILIIFNNSTVEYVQSVETRSTKIKRVHPSVLPKLKPLDITPEFIKVNAGKTDTLHDDWFIIMK